MESSEGREDEMDERNGIYDRNDNDGKYGIRIRSIEDTRNEKGGQIPE